MPSMPVGSEATPALRFEGGVAPAGGFAPALDGSPIAATATGVLSRTVVVRRDIGFTAAVFVASRVLMVALAAVVPLEPGQRSAGWLGRLVGAADARWYLTIATGGYAHLPLATALSTHRPENWVFFPLFPESARLLSDLLGTPALWTGVVLANACFLGFALYLHRWVRSDRGVRSARVAVALACLCPCSAYFVGFRPDSLFMLLSVACLERTASRRPGQAATAGALASLAHPTGLLLVVPFVVGLSWHGGRGRAAWRSLALAPLFGAGAVVMAWVSARDAGTALAFVKEQAAWGRAFRVPLAAFVPFFHHPMWVTGFGWTSPPVAIAASLIGLSAVVVLWRRRAVASSTAYLLVTVLMASASTTLLALPRFIAEAPPLYVAGALTRRRLSRTLVAGSAALLVAYTTCWLLGFGWTMA